MQQATTYSIKTILIWLVLTEIVLMAGLWAFKFVVNGRLRPPVTVSTAPPYDYEVVYTDTGYSPAFLEVPLGSRVAFRNASASQIWTASDPPQLHTDYPQFNAGRDYGPNEVYIFRFDAPGTYGFGNDRQVANHGAVRVQELGSAANNNKTPPEQVEVRDQLLALLKPGDPQSVFHVIDLIEADKDLSQSCHTLAHDLGHRAYQLYGFSGAMNVSDSTRLSKDSVQDICAGGYVHGLLEEAALFRQDFETDPGQLCAGVTGPVVASCFHGLGHAFMFASARDYDESLGRCRNFGGQNAVSCFEGVWMELFWSKTEESEVNLGWNPDKPLEPCAQAKDDAKAACYLYSSFGYLRTHPKDYRGAVRLCVTSGLNAFDTQSCVGGVGILMIGHFGGQHLEQAEPFAEGLKPNAKKAFYRGILNYAGFSGISKESLQAMCDALVHDGAICSEVLAKPAPTTS
jgi:hypothetical protein